MKVIDAANCLTTSAVEDNASPSFLSSMERKKLFAWLIIDFNVTAQLRPPVPLCQRPVQNVQYPACHALALTFGEYVSSPA